jgi:hypothetical protein
MTTDLLFSVLSVAFFGTMMEILVTEANHKKGRIPASLLTFLFPVFSMAFISHRENNAMPRRHNETEGKEEYRHDY